MALIAAVSTRPPSKYWERYICCHSAEMLRASWPMRNCLKWSTAPTTAFSRKLRPDSPTPESPPAVTILTTQIMRMSGSLMA